MRVRIQYSVEFNEIPEKPSGFLKNACEELCQQVGLLAYEAGALKEGVSEDSLELIDKVRRKLAEVDATLSDTQSILSGFVQAQAQPEENIAELTPEAVDVVSEG